jgi:hypothetical protein
MSLCKCRLDTVFLIPIERRLEKTTILDVGIVEIRMMMRSMWDLINHR